MKKHPKGQDKLKKKTINVKKHTEITRKTRSIRSIESTFPCAHRLNTNNDLKFCVSVMERSVTEKYYNFEVQVLRTTILPCITKLLNLV